MSKKSHKKRIVKPRMDGDRIIIMTALEATRAARPKYDGFVCRGGIHGDTSYNRRKFKAETRRILRDEL